MRIMAWLKSGLETGLTNVPLGRFLDANREILHPEIRFTLWYPAEPGRGPVSVLGLQSHVTGENLT